VTRAEIEDIRGVIISRGTLDTLMEAGWIKPKGRKETVGRPVTWVTTDEFLLHFGLGNVSELPGLDELKATGLVGPRPALILSETTEEAEPESETEPAFDPEESGAAAE
ncbi:MAG: SMC-Scp complex subunit ScpB, partial [Stellaceae bacterium]